MAAFEVDRALYKAMISDQSLPLSVRQQVQRLFETELPRDSSMHRVTNRCGLTGRSHGVYRWVCTAVARPGWSRMHVHAQPCPELAWPLPLACQPSAALPSQAASINRSDAPPVPCCVQGLPAEPHHVQAHGCRGHAARSQEGCLVTYHALLFGTTCPPPPQQQQQAALRCLSWEGYPARARQFGRPASFAHRHHHHHPACQRSQPHEAMYGLCAAVPLSNLPVHAPVGLLMLCNPPPSRPLSSEI